MTNNTVSRVWPMILNAKGMKNVLFPISQAVYGRIEGMYTRSQLMASLAEQKDHTLRLVGKVDELAGGLGDMEVCVEGCTEQSLGMTWTYFPVKNQLLHIVGYAMHV